MNLAIRKLRHRLVSRIMSSPRGFDIYVSQVKRRIKRTPEYLLLREIESKLPRPLQFMQIGANDGMRNDPIREFVVRGDWHGIFVEPNPFAFQLLKEHYAYCNRGQLHFREAAMSSEPGILPLYTHKPEFLRSLPREDALNLTRKTSTRREHVVNHGCQTIFGDSIPGARENVVLVEIPCVTVAQAMEGVFEVPRLDLLVMDVEGHEYNVLQSIDFQAIEVKAIYFEFSLLGENEAKVRTLLESQGYRLYFAGIDALAVHESVPWERG